MKPLTEQILDLKTEAKNHRDRGLKGYERARARLRTAIDLAQKGLEATTAVDAKRGFTKELADCHGLIGGVERRWGVEGDAAARAEHLGASCIAYDNGYRYEWDPTYGTAATYNLVNRITGRLLLRPELLEIDDAVDLGGDIDPLNVKAALADATARIRERLANKNNFWSEADLALLQVLSGQAAPAAAYAPFFALSPPGFAFASALDALRPLAAAGVATAPALADAVALLTARRPTS